MLIKLFGGLFRRSRKLTEEDHEASLDKAARLMESGDLHAAVEAYKEHLKHDPYNVGVLNNMGVCLMDIGKQAEASAAFELAYAMDDSYIPGIVNHAKMYIEQGRGEEGLWFLRQAKICAPDYTHTDAVYASFCLRNGDAATACHFQKRAWLASFDKMRYANSYLFFTAYDDVDEASLAMEHRFWGDTVRPTDDLEVDKTLTPDKAEIGLPAASRKLRIGYWSPDFRSHSVRYFSRPLIENHDLSRVEVLLYHDGPVRDSHTEALEKAVTEFHDVYKLSDSDLYQLIVSHHLDVLVELAGHTSYNRITLLQNQFATVQMTALGYPPTLGLATVDAKVLDSHIVTPDSARYYTERPLALPGSFWCFDPMEDVSLPSAPPMLTTGHVTFGCVGNLAKINARMLRCWKTILDRVPHSRLLVRSISCNDPAIVQLLCRRLTDIGIDMSRVDLRKPELGTAFFESYGEIDIILDTFPFNGGTTTCFAAYMGVAVVSLAGQSLNSRMGLSIMSNLGAADLAVTTESAYIERAVALANDAEALSKFRREARGLFRQSSLGDGKLYAQEFEDACQILVDQKKSGAAAYETAIGVLPADEIVRRAYGVLGGGQPEAAQRILNYCLKHHPDHGGVHLLVAQLVARGQGFEDAIKHLAERLEMFSASEKTGALITIVRWRLLQGKHDMAKDVIASLAETEVADEFDRLQVELYRACCEVSLNDVTASRQPAPSVVGSGRIQVLVPCDDVSRFDDMCEQARRCCMVPEGWSVSYTRCGEGQRQDVYAAAFKQTEADILIIAQQDIDLHGPRFFGQVIDGLESCDVLGMAGAKRWDRLNWRTDAFDQKAAGFFTTASEDENLLEVQWQGLGASALVGDLAILDGKLLAVRQSARLREVPFDDELVGADYLLEEEWTHAAVKAGMKLAVHRNLGIMVHPPQERHIRVRTPGLMRALEKYGFDPWANGKEDMMTLSAPVRSPQVALRTVDRFLEISA